MDRNSKPIPRRSLRGKAIWPPLQPGSARCFYPPPPSCSSRPPAAKLAPGETEADALQTFAGIPPVSYLVKRIGGPHVRVEVLVQPGQDPHIFEPTPRQVMRLSRASLFFKIGIPFEEMLTEHIAAGNARTVIVDTAAEIQRRTSGDPDDEAAPIRTFGSRRGR